MSGDRERETAVVEAIVRQGAWVEPLAPADLDKVTIEVRRRRGRRRAAVGSGVVVAVVGASLGVAQLMGGSGPVPGPARHTQLGSPTASASVIPWTAIKPVPPPTPPACSKDDLTFRLGRRGVWHGQASLQIEIRNQSTFSCTVLGEVAVSAMGAARGTVEMSQDQTDGPAALGPRDALMVVIGIQAGCSSTADNATALSISVGSIASASLPGADVRVDCGAPRLIETYVEAKESSTAEVPMSATIDAPAAVAAGDTLRFDVTLSNPSTTAIRFDECPTYSMALKAIGSSSAYQLNCAASPQIPAGGSVTFAMELAIPSGSAATGDQLLTWNLRGFQAADSVAITVE